MRVTLLSGLCPGQNPENNVILTMNVISLKTRQLHNCEAAAVQKHTLLHPVMYQGTIKYSPNQKTIISILLTPSKVASVLISTS